MKFDPQKHHRHSIRLPGYDYTQPGAYFVTLCTWQRTCMFGEVEGGNIHLNCLGKVARDQWVRLCDRFPKTDFSIFVIMPNHLHGIVMISSDNMDGADDLSMSSRVPQPLPSNAKSRIVAGSLGAIVRAYKAAVTWRLHAAGLIRHTPVWMRNYYEHIIRGEKELQTISDYIETNPIRWDKDQYNPSVLQSPHTQK